MQFQGKLMNKTQENSSKPHFGPDLGPFVPNSGCKICFSKIWLRQSLDIVVNYHHVQYQKKLMIQSRENLVTDRPRDKGMDGWTDKNDLTGFCPNNVERLKYK